MARIIRRKTPFRTPIIKRRRPKARPKSAPICYGDQLTLKPTPPLPLYQSVELPKLEFRIEPKPEGLDLAATLKQGPVSATIAGTVPWKGVAAIGGIALGLWLVDRAIQGA
jgi:hypothetical protein